MALCVAAPIAWAGPPSPPAGARLQVASAVRCAECHGRIVDQWKQSAHAGAERGPLYLAMKKRAKEPASCEGCHAPFLAVASADDAGAREAVNCDACHRIASVSERPTGATFSFRAEGDVKLGPICKPQETYFHQSACSPLFTESTLCGACHELHVRSPSGNDLPVFTEYEEWKKGPVREDGMECRACHMPGERAEATTGSGVARTVRSHAFTNLAGATRERAVSLKVTVEPRGEALRVLATVENVGAGHAVPAGLPGSRLLLRVRALDEQGAEKARGERRYARVLVDEAGREAPFVSALRVGEDTRIGPRERRRETFELSAPGATQVVAELSLRRESPEVARALGVEPSPEVALKSMKVRVPRRARSRGAGGRAR